MTNRQYFIFLIRWLVPIFQSTPIQVGLINFAFKNATTSLSRVYCKFSKPSKVTIIQGTVYVPGNVDREWFVAAAAAKLAFISVQQKVGWPADRQDRLGGGLQQQRHQQHRYRCCYCCCCYDYYFNLASTMYQPTLLPLATLAKLEMAKWLVPTSTFDAIPHPPPLSISRSTFCSPWYFVFISFSFPPPPFSLSFPRIFFYLCHSFSFSIHLFSVIHAYITPRVRRFAGSV